MPAYHNLREEISTADKLKLKLTDFKVKSCNSVDQIAFIGIAVIIATK